MSWKNASLCSFSALRSKFFSGESSPRDLLEKCISNIELLESSVHAFVTIDLAAARRAADASTERYRLNQPLSLLDGCPTGVKDIIATCDFPTQMGSPAFAGYQTRHDAACVHALRSGGAIIIGKTVTTEFAIGESRQTTNPFDVTRTPGGSSSGSAAAVGAGMLPLALATQTQASTLRPASYCGAYAFKPTHGAFRMEGVHIMSPTSDHVGLIGASLNDIWDAASRIALSVGGSGAECMQRAGEPIVAKKPIILIRLYSRGWNEIDHAGQSAFEGVIQKISDLGINIIDRHTHGDIEKLERVLDECLDKALEIVVYEMQWPFQDYVDRYGDRIGSRIHRMMDQARSMSSAQYIDLLGMRRDLQRQLNSISKEFSVDGFILPASSGPAPVGLTYTGSRTFPSFANLVGFPALTLPRMSVNDEPFGIQLFHTEQKDYDLMSHACWIDERLNA